MAITLSTAARNAAADAVVDLIDGGTGAGNLVFQTSGDVEVATLAFSATAFGGASSGTATAFRMTRTLPAALSPSLRHRTATPPWFSKDRLARLARIST